ncbi:MAG: hypothetical protein JXQ73_07060, partial [Phycisphaerae bacterium]|nr:hypothetical protein [Phycisphaerae bacterium]
MAGDRLLRGCDVATSEDTLGFGPHVEAVRDFLLDADLPLTMSVEAEWGGGKTSFMLQLKEALAEAAKEGAEVRTVWFNAWRHEKADSLWAAFALQFGEELSRQTSRWKRAGVAVRLARARFDWRLGWWAGVRTVAHVLVWAIVLIVAVVVFLTGGSLPAEFWGGYLKLHWLVGAGAATAAWRLYGAARSALGNPFQYNLGKYLRRPDYAGRVAFVEEFHKDFARVVRAYLGAGKGGDGGRVFVFVDDLDRCDAPKAAELLQSLNLMIPLDSGEQAKRVGYVLGIDRPKVAAAVTAKYKDLLPYLSEGRGGEKGDDEDDRATFGYAFIEKFVQIPFWLPVPGEEELIASLTGGQARPVEQRAVGAAWGFRTDRGDPQWRHFVAMAARFLGRNPRRCKQFRSLLVLRARVWCRIEETQYEQGDPEAIWPGQFAKLILINLLRPTVYRALREEPGLLLGL